MNNQKFFNGPFKTKYPPCNPIHFEPPKLNNIKPDSILLFNSGPFNVKHNPCLPIHFQPPKNTPIEIKKLKPWMPNPNKSHYLFLLDSQKLKII